MSRVRIMQRFFDVNGKGEVVRPTERPDCPECGYPVAYIATMSVDGSKVCAAPCGHEVEKSFGLKCR